MFCRGGIVRIAVPSFTQDIPATEKGTGEEALLSFKQKFWFGEEALHQN